MSIINLRDGLKKIVSEKVKSGEKIQTIFSLLEDENIIKNIKEYIKLADFLIKNHYHILSLFNNEKNSIEFEKFQNKILLFTNYFSDYLAASELIRNIYVSSTPLKIGVKSKSSINNNSNSNSGSDISFSNPTYLKKSENNPKEKINEIASLCDKIFNSESPSQEIISETFNRISGINLQNFTNEQTFIIINYTIKLFPFCTLHQRRILKRNYKTEIEKIFKSRGESDEFIQAYEDALLVETSREKFMNISSSFFDEFFKDTSKIYEIYYYSFQRKNDFDKVKCLIFIRLYFFLFDNSISTREKEKYFICKNFFQDKIDFPRYSYSNINNISTLFDLETNKMFSEVIENIKFFYRSRFYQTEKLLFSMEDLNFVFGVAKLYQINKKYLSETRKMKKKLISLEKKMIDNYQRAIGESITIFDKVTIKKKFIDIYEKLKNEILQSLNGNLSKYSNRNIIDLIPFGSITQCLGGKDSDLDLLLVINAKENVHGSILKEIEIILRRKAKKLSVIISSRLCLLSFEYQKMKIDINYYGICSVYGGCLFRALALYDIRLSILAVNLKQIIKKYGIKNEKDNLYLNSFSWMLILITFLQDILYPPMLPKLLTIENIKEQKINVRTKPKNLFKKTDISQVPSSSRPRKFYIPRRIDELDGKKFEQHNKMSCSEILIKFFEFVGFYFNYKYVFVNTGFFGQNFYSKIFLIKHEIKDDLMEKFYEHRYVIGRNSNKETRIKDLTRVYLREPFDHTYNPAKQVENERMDEIIEVAKKIYEKMVSEGKLY